MTLRPYQREAVDATYEYLRNHSGNPCVVIPTAGGKTWIIATICSDAVQIWSGRVLILAHVKELLEQAVEKIRLVAPDVPVGIYSAGLKRRDVGYAVTIAGIQSVYKRADVLGPFDLIIVDEAHLIPPSDEGMYRKFLGDAKVINPNVRVIGLTATPYRMKSGLIYGPEMIFDDACYEVGIRELIAQGYLCRLRSKAGTQRPDYDQLHVRGGEYIAGEVENLMDDDELVNSACREIVEHTKDRKSVLIFAAGIGHANHVVRVLEQRHQVECGFICGETLPFERDATLQRFRSGELKYLCNVNVLTTGFDAPNIDCVALLRPTLSPGLYSQMLGRGFRLHPGKDDCLVLDFGGNVLRHGPVDQVRVRDPDDGDRSEAPARECPECKALIAAGYTTCPECGHEFPPREREKHSDTATDEGVLSDEVTTTEYEVTDVCYAVHTKRNAPIDAPRTLRVDYRVGFGTYIPEWICFEHEGYARRKAEQWWSQRSQAPVPTTIEKAVELAEQGVLAETLKITVRRRAGDKFDRIIAYEIGDIPDMGTPAGEPCPGCGRIERTRQDRDGVAVQEVCTWCSRWLRSVPEAELPVYSADEIPF